MWSRQTNGVLHVKLPFETTPIFYTNAEAIFKIIFCRPYIDTLHILVTLSYLAKNFFNVRDLDKTVLCLQFLLLERPPFSYMNGDKNSVLSPILTFGTAPIFLYERWHNPPVPPPLPVFISLFRRSYAYTLHILVTPKSLAQKLLKFLRLCQILAIFNYTQCKNA